MTADSTQPRSSLWPRIIAAAVLVPVTLMAAYLGSWAFAAWIGLAGLAMSVEWVQIVHRERFGWRFALHALAISASLALAALGHATWGWQAILISALIGAVAAQARDERGIWVILGILYIATPCLALFWIRDMQILGFETVMWLLFVVWATDSVAYAAGSFFKGPKLAPAVSPGKTWAGAVAGVAAAGLISAVIALIAHSHVGIVVACGVVLSLLTQLGDLAESLLKRRFGVKDMSDLIPGHGGALDRLDGLLFATLGVAGFVLVTGLSPLAWLPAS